MSKKHLFGPTGEARNKLIKETLKRNVRSGLKVDPANILNAVGAKTVSNKYTKIEELQDYKKLELLKVVADQMGIESPFFIEHEGPSGANAMIDGKEYINFSNYNYLGLNGDERVSQAAKDAIDQYGTSVSASRIVSGERKIHRQLEKSIAQMLGTQDCVAMVSGHAANVTTIGYLLGPKDLIIHDALAHNSIVQGALLSGATRRRFDHGDVEALDTMLKTERHKFERVLICVEGVYSMDGDTAPVDKLIELKKRHKCWLMVDEAHSAGVLGKTGRGVVEHFNVDVNDIDILMGTLSKSFCSAGGYIAGKEGLILLLKYNAPGFLYSVGISPPVAAASLKAIEIMFEEPDRVKKVQDIGKYFLQRAKEYDLDVGSSEGYAVIPIIVHDSSKAGKLSNALFKRGINAQPIFYPVVEESKARLRFFVSSDHTQEQVDLTLKVLVEELNALK